MSTSNEEATGFARVEVDVDVCEAAGVCNRIAPQVFQLDDDDVNHVLKQSDTEELDRKVRLAVRRCPKQALGMLDVGPEQGESHG